VIPLVIFTSDKQKMGAFANGPLLKAPRGRWPSSSRGLTFAAHRHVPHLDRIGAPLRALLTLLLLATIAPSGGEAQQDSLGPKSRYNLFHRTPVELRRPMTTDRPDRTESPYTVDAGLFQAEIDLFTYGSDASADGNRGAGNAYSFLPSTSRD
jgi:hypothetical protein